MASSHVGHVGPGGSSLGLMGGGGTGRFQGAPGRVCAWVGCAWRGKEAELGKGPDRTHAPLRPEPSPRGGGLSCEGVRRLPCPRHLGVGLEIQ